MKHEYGVQILWSTEDNAYLAMCLELPGAVADGGTPEEALKQLRLVIADWVEVATEEGREVPKPTTMQEVHKQETAFQKQLQTQFDREVRAAVARLLENMPAHQQRGTFYVRGTTLAPEMVGR